MSRRTALVVEDDALMRTTLVGHLGERLRVLAATSCEEARAIIGRQQVDVVILDLSLPDGDGLALVDVFRKEGEPEVIVITAYPKIQSAVRALKAGAFDYINKPFELDEFDIVVEKALEHHGLRDEVASLRRQRPSTGPVDRILGDSPAIARVRDEVARVARSPDTTVLVRGESGTGKELVAEAIHHEGHRRSEPFVRVNCSSIPATMLETELFGHERGAFTDARSSRRGLLEVANGGTLFLDEIGDMPLELQPKLLTVLESRRFRRVGGNREVDVDVRFVAATNRDLDGMVAASRFRGDLLFRLKVFEIAVPPLRDRRDDVPLIAHHFLRELGRRLGGQTPTGIAPDALARLTSYAWPGNVRELRNVIERALILARTDRVELSDLPCDLTPIPPAACDGCPAFPDGLGTLASLEEIERRYILCVYRMCGHNKTRAAETLGISRLTLREKIRQIGLGDDGG